MKRIVLPILFLLWVALPVYALGEVNNGCETDAAVCAGEMRGKPDDGEDQVPPQFEPRGPYAVFAGETLEFDVRAIAQNGGEHKFVYSALSLPSGARFNDGSREFSWKLLASQAGTHEARFRVADKKNPELEDILTVSISVALREPDCSVNGFFGSYYNLPKDHPDVETRITGVTTGTTPFAQDWFSDGYLSFTRNDEASSLNVASDYFPVDDELAGDPFYFAVHWRGTMRVPAAGEYPVELGSDDDSWLYVNGQNVIDLGGIHSFGEAKTQLSLPEGTSTIDIYFAERHTTQSGFRFAVVGEGVSFSPCGENGIPENRAPFFTGPNYASTTVSSTLEFSVIAADPDNDPLTVNSFLPEGATYETSTGRFSWIPTVVGTSTARFDASDGLATTTHEVSLEIFPTSTSTDPVNLPPSFVNFDPPRTATATIPYRYDAEAADPENDPLSFELFVSPSGMTIGSSTGLIEWVPESRQATSTPYGVSVRVSDGRNATSTSFSILVSPFSTSTTGGGDDPGDDNNDGGNNTGGNSGFVGGSSNSGGGSSGGGGGGSSAPNRPPQFVNFSPPLYATATRLYLYDAEAIDPEGDPVRFSLIGAPEGMAIVSITGFTYWIPGRSQARTEPYLITLEATDGKAATQISYQLQVVDVPVINSAPLQPIIEEEPAPAIRESEPEIGGTIHEDEDNISTSTLGVGGSVQAGDETLGARLLAGLSYYLGSWIGYVLGFIALIGFLLFLFFTRDREEQEEAQDEPLSVYEGKDESNGNPDLSAGGFTPRIIGDQ